MPNYTTNYNLKKPLQEEFYNVDDFNGNADIIDATLKLKADLVNGKVPREQLPVGGANGIAGLDASGNVSTDNLPIGVPNGIVGLDASGKLPASAVPDGVGGGKRASRITVGSSVYGWTTTDCDYLCDGTADEVEINAAITALRSTGGEVVLLDGNYNLTSPISITKDRVTLRGNGNNTKIIRGFNNTASTLGLVTVEADYCTIRDLYFDGVKGTYTSSSNNSIYVYRNYNSILNNTCLNSSYNAIRIAGDYNHISGNTCTNNTSSGVVTSTSDHIVIANNIFSSNGDHGIELHNTDHSTITGNVCSHNGMNGIDFISCENNTIVGNTFNGNTDQGMDIYSGLNNMVSGNTFNSNGKYAVTLQSGSSYNYIMVNTYIGNTSGAVSNTGTNNTVGAVAKSGDTMVGQLVAGLQTPTNYCVRNNKISATEETPTVEGAISWLRE